MFLFREIFFNQRNEKGNDFVRSVTGLARERGGKEKRSGSVFPPSSSALGLSARPVFKKAKV
jgi:hypothetical protein